MASYDDKSEGERARDQQPNTDDEEEARRAAVRQKNTYKECRRHVASGEFYHPFDGGVRQHLRCVDWSAQRFPAQVALRSMRYLWHELQRCAQETAQAGRAIGALEQRWARDRKKSDSAGASLMRVIYATRRVRAALSQHRLDRLLCRFCYREGGDWWAER